VSDVSLFRNDAKHSQIECNQGFACILTGLKTASYVRNRRVLFLVLYLFSVALVGVFLYWALRQPSSPIAQQPLVSLLLALLVPPLLSAGGLALKPFRDFLDSWVKRDLDRSLCRIYLFGHRGSGKTSLITNIYSAELPAKLASTVHFDFYKRDITYDLKGTTRFEVLTADYQGEKPAMAILDLPEEFAGPPDDRAINIVIFLVDLMPRLLDENGRVLGDKEILLWLQDDAEEKIRKRVAEHLDYLTAPMLQIVFASVYSPQLRSVRLVVTKLDLVQEACAHGYLSCGNASDIADWIRAHFVRIEQDIRRASEVNNIPDFSVHLVSTTQDLGMRAMLSQLWKTHLKATGVQII